MVVVGVQIDVGVGRATAGIKERDVEGDVQVSTVLLEKDLDLVIVGAVTGECDLAGASILAGGDGSVDGWRRRIVVRCVGDLGVVEVRRGEGGTDRGFGCVGLPPGQGVYNASHRDRCQDCCDDEPGRFAFHLKPPLANIEDLVVVLCAPGDGEGDQLHDSIVLLGCQTIAVCDSASSRFRAEALPCTGVFVRGSLLLFVRLPICSGHAGAPDKACQDDHCRQVWCHPQ